MLTFLQYKSAVFLEQPVSASTLKGHHVMLGFSVKP